MLRSYAAVHGMSSPQHAVIEVGAEEIVLRIDLRWTRFTHDTMTTSAGLAVPFTMHEDGRVSIGTATEGMDMAAESVAREIMVQ